MAPLSRARSGLPAATLAGRWRPARAPASVRRRERRAPDRPRCRRYAAEVACATCPAGAVSCPLTRRVDVVQRWRPAVLRGGRLSSAHPFRRGRGVPWAYLCATTRTPDVDAPAPGRQARSPRVGPLGQGDSGRCRHMRVSGLTAEAVPAQPVGRNGAAVPVAQYGRVPAGAGVAAVAFAPESGAGPADRYTACACSWCRATGWALSQPRRRQRR